MFRPFPILDSLVLAAAVFAVSGCLVFLVGGKEADPWVYALVLAGLVFALLAYLGQQRGRDNLDGVFIGPVVRISAFAILVGAGGLWIWLSAPAQEPPCVDCPPPPPPPTELSEACRQRLERVESMLSALEAIASGAREELADSAEFRGAYNLLESSDRLLGTCRGSEIDDHVRRRNALLEELREYYNTPTQRPIASIADAITRNSAKAGEPEKPPFEIETEPSDVQDAPPRVYVVFDDPAPPDSSSADSPGNGGSSGESPAPTRRRVEYRPDLRSDLLAILLGGFGFSWGTVKITVEEVEGAIEEVAKQNSGQPLDDLFDNRNLSQVERNAFIQKLVELGLLEEAAGSEWSAGVKIYISGRLGTALCLAISRDIDRSGIAFAGTDLNELLQRRVDRSPQDRIEIDAEVRGCLEGLVGDRSQHALERYQVLVDASGG